ncbi:MAG: sigma-54-dependent Fis family transcriptional regulator, partial [Deltaproteobacteria bacterium]|nr:sigma-54-dependent Fis family transcriptional regulator [Deltaproteobacteria bacterium]
MSDQATLPDETRSAGDPQSGPSEAICWVVAACPDEPDRIGEVLLVPCGQSRPPRVFGRGAAQPDDPHPRVLLVRQRPEGNRATPALALARVSRVQLELRGRPDGRAVDVTNVGRCALLVNGAPTTAASVQPGDVVELGRQIAFLCVRRPEWLDDVESGFADAPFGVADAFGMVGESAAIWRVRRTVAFAAAQPGHVLVTGPSGAGKELVARAVHSLSRRARGPFVARSAATLPAGLIDAELFGNARNYPNPGMPERAGLVGQAAGGTLFLDEIGELSEELQAHLLRVLDAGEYQRLGDGTTRVADFRLVGATNRPLERLKHDLLARFTLRAELPGLEDRREDIPLLARHLLRRLAAGNPTLATRFFAGGTPRGEPRLSLPLVRHLLQIPYPTNTRDLERQLLMAIERSRAESLEGPPSPGDALLAEAPTGHAGPVAAAPGDAQHLSAERVQA